MSSIRFEGVEKSFGAVRASRGLSFEIPLGTIHAIVGENGAGKSTAMKMLFGEIAPDAGRILVGADVCAFRSSGEAIAAGLGMVHQHFMLAGPQTVLDNILLGEKRLDGGWRWLPEALRPQPRARARARLEELIEANGFEIPLDAMVESLPVGVQQRIEILKLLYRDSRILILDEPTAVLTPQETETLFQQLRRLRDAGRTIVIITHKLREVLSLAQKATVFRQGAVVRTVETAGLSEAALAELMVGRAVALQQQKQAPAALDSAPAVLEVAGLTVHGPGKGRAAPMKLRNVSFRVRSGEVVGIAGVEGNGQSELLHAILDPALRSAGEVSVCGNSSAGLDTRGVRDLGVGFVPQDRHREGLLLDESLEQNFLLGLQRERRFSGTGGLFKRKAVRSRALEMLARFEVTPLDLDRRARSLSGGNQQKLILAREFSTDPKLLVVAQPSRGVDVGAIEAIHAEIRAAASRGAGVLLVSSELDEILALSDTILVLCGGVVRASFAAGRCDKNEIGLHMGGGAQREHHA